MKKRIYILGPMTEHRERGWNFHAFDKAKRHLEAAGHEVISPADLDRKRWNKPHDWVPPKDWEISDDEMLQILLDDITALWQCDGAYALKGWHRSDGCGMEYHVCNLRKRYDKNFTFEEEK